MIIMNIEEIKNKNKPLAIGWIKAVTPRTKVEFATTDPIVSPRAMSLCPFRTACMLKDSSGRDVPRATKNNPIKIGGKLKSMDSNSAYFTV